MSATSREARSGRVTVGVTAAFLAILMACAPSGASPAGKQTPSPLPPLERGGAYTSLGSSFAAGPDIPPNDGGTCLRSEKNYAHLTAAALGLRLTDVSCSGALTAGLSEPGLGGTPAQVSAVTKATRLVTVTVGGNDIGYATTLGDCTVLARRGQPCPAANVLLDRSGDKLLAFRTRLLALLQEILHRAPYAHVYVVSYLTILPPDGTPCPPNVPLLTATVKALASVGTKLKDATQSAAAQAKVAFLDTSTPSLGHSACAAPSTRWVEGTRRVLPAFAYHPNVRGMTAVADLLVAAIRQGG